jgi:hypothetical protein
MKKLLLGLLLLIPIGASADSVTVKVTPMGGFAPLNVRATIRATTPSLMCVVIDGGEFGYSQRGCSPYLIKVLTRVWEELPCGTYHVWGEVGLQQHAQQKVIRTSPIRVMVKGNGCDDE